MYPVIDHVCVCLCVCVGGGTIITNLFASNAYNHNMENVHECRPLEAERFVPTLRRQVVYGIWVLQQSTLLRIFRRRNIKTSVAINTSNIII